MDVKTFLFVAPIVLGSLTLHELAHAWVAWRLGDPTAHERGRLTLNPIAHLDPLGTTMFALTALLSNFPFGWAKPVPVDPRYFRRPKEGMALVGAAGPAMNFVVALVCLFLFRHVGLSAFWTDVLRNAYIVNVILGLFNLIPVPPLDGSRIVGAAMDNATYYRWIQLDQYGMLIVFGLLIVFRGQFTALLADGVNAVTRVMDVIVAA